MKGRNQLMGVRIPLTPLCDYMDCIFCKIVKGEIPCYKVYEDDKILAFLDIKPKNPGHTLIMPKKHYRWVWDVTEIGELFMSVKKIADALRKAMNTHYISSAIEGDEISHAHIHLIPRFKDESRDKYILHPSNTKEISKEEMERIAEKIRNSF
jgi:histidine triad (HIT) family protein